MDIALGAVLGLGSEPASTAADAAASEQAMEVWRWFMRERARLRWIEREDEAKMPATSASE